MISLAKRWIVLGFPILSYFTSFSQEGRDSLAIADPVFRLQQSTGRIHIAKSVWVLEDRADTLSLEDVLTRKWQREFVPLTAYPTRRPPHLQDSIMYLAPEGRNNWLRIILQNELLTDSFLLFPFSPGTMANFGTAYIFKSDGTREIKQFGKLEPLSQLHKQDLSPITHNLRRNLFSFVLAPNDRVEIIIQYRHDSRFGSQLYSDPTVISYPNVGRQFARFRDHYRWRAFYQGILWMFIGFSLLNFMLRRDLAYLFYGFYVISLSLVMSFDLFENSLQLFIFPNHPALSYRLYHLGAGGMIVFYLLFLQSFLQAQKALPRWNKGVRILAWCGIGSTLCFQLVALFPLYHIGVVVNSIFVCSILFFTLCGLAYVAYLVKWNNVLARFILTGTGFLLAGSLLYALAFLGAASSIWNIEPVFLMKIGTITELLVFSVGLAYRDRIVEVEKHRIEELDRVKTRLFTNISHEFRTPLTLIKAPLEDLLMSSDKEEERVVFSQIHKNTERLLLLVNQLLELSKLESGTLKLAFETHEVFSFVRQLVGNFQSLADQKKLDYQVHIPDEALLLVYDQDKLEKIMLNLLSNAIKFAPNKGWVKVEVQYTHKLLIRIGNSGPPIPVEEQAQLFERFYQADITRHQGTGIGLALVRELVDLYQGVIGVESSAEQGTWFQLSLPVPISREADPIIFADKPSMKALESPIIDQSIIDLGVQSIPANPVLLLVEDHAEVRAYVAKKLASHFTIVEAKDGKAGLQKAMTQIPDIIISDLMMPNMDGISLCKQVKSDPRTDHIPFILLTAKADVDSRLVGLEIGADDYLAKPFNSQELLIRCQNLIQLRMQMREHFSRQIALKPSAVAVTSTEERFVQQAIELVETNLAKTDFSIEDFAKGMHLSRTHLHRKLKAITGFNATDFVRNLRLERAAQLLEQESDSVSQIAFAVGFNNLSYFAKCFKEKFGVTPSGFSKKPG